MSNFDKDIRTYGFVVGGDYNLKGNYFYAEVVPSGAKWYRTLLPWVGRWWYEVHEIEVKPTDEYGIGSISHAYIDKGSGGAYTLRSCVNKAMDSISDKAMEESQDD